MNINNIKLCECDCDYFIERRKPKLSLMQQTWLSLINEDDIYTTESDSNDNIIRCHFKWVMNDIPFESRITITNGSYSFYVKTDLCKKEWFENVKNKDLAEIRSIIPCIEKYKDLISSITEAIGLQILDNEDITYMLTNIDYFEKSYIESSLKNMIPNFIDALTIRPRTGDEKYSIDNNVFDSGRIKFYDDMYDNIKLDKLTRR